MTEIFSNTERDKLPTESDVSSAGFDDVICGLTISELSASTQANLNALRNADGYLPAVDFCSGNEDLTPDEAAHELYRTGNEYLDAAYADDPARSLIAINFQLQLQAAAAKGPDFVNDMVDELPGFTVSDSSTVYDHYFRMIGLDQDGRIMDITGSFKDDHGVTVTDDDYRDGESTMLYTSDERPGILNIIDWDSP